MNILFICLSLLFVQGLNAPEPNTINVTTTAKVELPADRIQFTVTVNAEADSPQQAYQKHQQKEQALVSLLEQYNIDEENIQYEPLSISEYRDRDLSEDDGVGSFYRTRQTVNVTFSDFDVYENIQISLIEHGFDEFQGRFLTTGKEEGMKKALRKAIQKAKNTAQLMAQEAGVAIGSILHITYSEPTVQPYATPRVAMASTGSKGLLQYNQTVVISATVSMEFEIESVAAN